MKKLIFTVFLFLYSVISSNAQTITNATEFYSYLNSILENKSNKFIQLRGTDYGTLGSKFNWEAKIKKKRKNIEVVYNSQIPNEENDSDLIKMQLDTTFVTTRNKLIQNFKTEITSIESRPVYFALIVKVVVNTTHSNKEFTLKRADGLSFLLRYDRSFEEYYKQKK